MELQNGSSLQNGKYIIISTLGKGGFGITYLANHEGLNRQVAIKEFFMKDFCSREGSNVRIANENNRTTVDSCKRKFLNEAKNIAALSNAHIVRIHDIFEENGTAYYVMEFLKKGSMKDKIEIGGPIKEEQAINYITQVAEALYHTHSKNILHLDIKPANIMMDSCNLAVLIDFGISRRYDNEGGATSTSTIGVSEGFSPLEQYAMDGLKDLSPETDIYSLGATLYYMLTGEKPPKASVVNENGLPTLPSGISSRTARAIRKAMSPKRSDRYHSVQSFVESLGGKLNVIDDTPGDDGTIIKTVSTERPGTTLNVDKPVKWKPIAIAVAAVLLTLACALGGHIWKNGQNTGEVPVTVSDKTTGSTNGASKQKVETPPTPKNPPAKQKTTGTVSYGYAKYEGSLSNGKPDGSGILRFSSIHIIDGRDPQERVAEAGDYIDGSFKDGRLIHGNWYGADGNKKGFINIGE